MADQNNQQQAQDQNAGNAPDKGGQQDQTGQQSQASANMIPKARFDEVNEKRKTAEAELTAVAEQLMGDVPENFRELIPNLSPAEKIKWIRKANQTGLFNPPTPASIDTKRPGEKPALDLDKLTPLQMREAGYKS